VELATKMSEKHRSDLESSKMEMTKMKELMEITNSEVKDSHLTSKAKMERIDSLKAQISKMAN
jgi:hypothetical protein